MVLESHLSFKAWVHPTFCLMHSSIPTVEIQPWIISLFNLREHQRTLSSQQLSFCSFYKLSPSALLKSLQPMTELGTQMEVFRLQTPCAHTIPQMPPSKISTFCAPRVLYNFNRTLTPVPSYVSVVVCWWRDLILFIPVSPKHSLHIAGDQQSGWI